MVDVTAVLMVADTGVPDSPRRWRQGEIVNIRPYLGSVPALNPAFTNLHVTGIPDTVGGTPITLQLIRETFERSHTTDPERLETDPDAEHLGRRRWVLDYSTLSPPRLSDLVDDRNLTLSWNQLKASLRKRQTSRLTLGDLLDETDLL